MWLQLAPLWQSQVSLQSSPYIPEGHRFAQTLPIQPLVHVHLPVFELHVPLFWQRHSKRQSSPTVPSGHWQLKRRDLLVSLDVGIGSRMTYYGPVHCLGHVQCPVIWSQVPPFSQRHSSSHWSPYLSSGHRSSQYWPMNPLLHLHDPVFELQTASFMHKQSNWQLSPHLFGGQTVLHWSPVHPWSQVHLFGPEQIPFTQSSSQWGLHWFSVSK